LTQAGVLAVLLLCANLYPPHPPADAPLYALLLMTAAILEALAPSGCRVGTGWPALALASGFPGLGSGWLLTAHLALRSLLDVTLRSLAPMAALSQLGKALPVVAACAICHFLPATKGLLLALPVFLTLTLLLSPWQARSEMLRRSCEELLWFGLLVWLKPFGVWAVLAGLMALLIVFSRPLPSQDQMLGSLARQMTSTESTLRKTKERFQQDKGRFRNVISLQQALDEFQRQALLTESSQGLAQSLLDAAVSMHDRCQAGVGIAGADDQLKLLAATRRFALSHFHPLPSGWKTARMLRPEDGKRCFYGLGGGMLFMMESDSEERGIEDDFLEQLLARARLVLRILEQKRELADLLRQRTEALNQLANSQAQLLQSEKLAAIGQLAAGVAHEINSPLAAVHLQAQMARRRLKKNDTEGVLRSLETCEQASLRAKAIIESLLAYSRYSDGTREAVQLADTVSATLRLLEGHLQQSQIATRVELENAVPVWGNPQEISQILTNIILNAVDALRQREGDRRLRIFAARSAGQQSLTVANNGPAIEESVLEKIFDPFFTTKDVGSGTGLGLSIAYQLARGHGGNLLAANRDGWVQFTLLLPLTSPAAETASASPRQ
jgi:C4-dicarboxylate-specific signal transduction histidine kinase